MNRFDRLQQIEANARATKAGQLPPEFSEWFHELQEKISASVDLKPGCHWSDWAWSPEELEERLGRPPNASDHIWKKEYTGPVFPQLAERLRMQSLFVVAFRNKAMRLDKLPPPLREQLSRALAERARRGVRSWNADQGTLGAPETFKGIQAEWMAEWEWRDAQGLSRYTHTPEEHARFLVKYYLGESALA